MNPKKKVLILLPDGVGLRNFAFTSFVEIGEKTGWEVIFWNQAPFDLEELGYPKISLTGKPAAKTDLLKRAKINAELDHFTAKFNDPVYQSYKFPASKKGFKALVKNWVVGFLINTHKGEGGIQRLRSEMKESERKGNLYKTCKATLEKEQPNFVFCTNQRSVNAIAPLTAAQDLDIPTGTFIFSWDNLPKATLVVETDHYFVWSEYMKGELLSYYPHIRPEQIIVSGTPQFEPHYNNTLIRSRKDFFGKHGLDLSRKYICFSGDDVTTSPDDPQYLDQVAEAVNLLNSELNVGIIFRRCPVDLSDRYDKVLEKHRDLIVPIEPEWEKAGEQWNTILPKKEDVSLLVNTIYHSDAVINVGSSMVFDFGIFQKPCLFINYDVEEKKLPDWSTKKVYNFVHFRSMPTGEEVLWLNSRKEIPKKLEDALKSGKTNVKKARQWFETINMPPAGRASERIWEALNQITKK